MSILYTGPVTPSVDEGDTLTLTAVALDASGNPLDVPIIWRVLELDTVQIPFTLDSLSGFVTGLFAGSARVQADADGLRTNLITVRVRGVADSIAAQEPSEITLAAADGESAPFGATVYDVAPDGTAAPIAGTPIRFSLVQPAPGSPEAAALAIGVPGQDPAADPHVATVTSGTAGGALITLRVLSAGFPDTAFVEAVALRPTGEVVTGTPARFTILIIGS